ncbi:hypothetical protein [Streptomyces sp. KL116D]|uniref:hypothetical protein n=1 Tax=Streptomyces sp. KL116D TaxID=3045152 RepID=UPI00355859D5
MLVAAFANSPMLRGRPTGWRVPARQVPVGWPIGSERSGAARATSRARAWALQHVLVYAARDACAAPSGRGTAPDGPDLPPVARGGRAAAARTRS